jgi:hypothetical protein
MAGILNIHILFDFPFVAFITSYHKNPLEIEYGVIAFSVWTMPA